MTDHETFGSGIYLTPTYDDFEDPDGYAWDLDTDQTGDLRMSYGEQELRKDVAFRASSRLQDIVGGPMRPLTISRIENAIRDILREEPRVDVIHYVDVEDSTKESVKIGAEVTAVDEAVEMIFEIDY